MAEDKDHHFDYNHADSKTMALRLAKKKFKNALIRQLETKRSKNCFKWVERGIMFQLFCSVSLLFCIFSLAYSIFFYLAVDYYKSVLILSQEQIIHSESIYLFDTIFNETMSLVNDYFNLTQ